MKRFILSSVLSLIALVGICQTKKIDGIKYTITSSTEVEVGSKQKVSGHVVIPEYVTIDRKQYKVTRIGNEAFHSCNLITTIIIPEGITSIGNYAFYSCSSLTTVSIPEGVSWIGERAFAECSRLQKVIMPNSLKNIGGFAFSGSGSLRNMVIPNSVTSIGMFAFWKCRNLETITVPDDCNAHSYFIFDACENLKEVRGHNIIYPRWIIDYLACPNDSNIPIIEWAKKVKDESYHYYAYNRIVELISEWQQKKEYETNAQWQIRVTEERRVEYLKNAQKQIREEYITKKKPAVLKSNLGSYDADYGVYTITTDGFGTFYLEVAMAEASQVKENWSQAEVLPTYGIADDKLILTNVEVEVNGKTYKTADRYEDAASDIAINLPPLQINLGGSDVVAPKPDITQAIDRSIDYNIPVVTNNNDRTFAVVIGNENYKEVAKVPHALNDAKVFAAYCEKTLGLPQKNIKQYADATFGTLLSAMENIQSIAKAYKGDINVIFYYAGHGIPDESSNEAYLLPVDANGRNTAACYPIDKLYGELKALGANQVTVFLDACFSGAQRGSGMLASARGVAIKAKQAAPQGNMVVFSAASADETAYPYNEKGHGLFTYYLLKKLNETKGDVTLGELGSYICEKVAQESVVSNGKSQTPTVVPSVSIVDNWKNLKLTK